MLKIWEEKEAPKKEYFLRLMTVCGKPAVVVVNDDGKRIFGTCIVEFQSDGTILRCPSIRTDVANAIGLSLDHENRIEFTP